MKSELETEQKPTESLEFWKQHLAKWQASGLSQAGYCRKSGIKFYIFRYWRKKIMATPTAKRRLIPLMPHSGKAREMKSDQAPSTLYNLNIRILQCVCYSPPSHKEVKMAVRYRVTLTKEERDDLEAISTKGKRAARTVLYARALLLLDSGVHGSKWTVVKVGEALGTTPRSLEHLKKRFVEDGLRAAIERKIRVKPPREVQFGGEFEAQLLALACSEAPEGRERWTIRLLAEKMVELKMVPSVSPMTVCNTLKKMNLSLT